MTCTYAKLNRAVICAFLLAGSLSCGGGRSTPPPGISTTVTINFSGPTPIAVAEQIGTGAWGAASLQGSKLTLTIPQGESRYAVAYVCPAADPFTAEIVVEATTQDPAPSGGCPSIPAFQQGAVTGSVDASAIPNAASVLIYGPLGKTTVAGVTGVFSLQGRQGNGDIAFVAVDASGGILGVKILRSQAIPGTVNGGQAVVLTQADVTTYQTISVKTPPDLTDGAGATATYRTANGTQFPVTVPGSQYALVPNSEAQAGDVYAFTAFEGLADLNSNGLQSVNVFLSEASPTAVTLVLPSLMTYSPPDPAAFPVFNVSYSGFGGEPNVSYSAALNWASSSSPSNILTVSATAAYQAGSNTLSVPDLTGVAGFFVPPPPATRITWIVTVSEGTPHSHAAAENIGVYFEP